MSRDDDTVPTGVAAKAIGVNPTTLGRWWRAGLVKPGFVTAGGHARWNIADLRRQVAKLHEQADDGD